MATETGKRVACTDLKSENVNTTAKIISITVT